MVSDIIKDLAVEKIRIDFGDLSATVFQILIIQRGCSIVEINKILPNVEYRMVRFVFFKLFNHNVLFLRKNNHGQKLNVLNLKNIKIYASLYSPIIRMRFPRFLSLIEKEYGNIAREISKKFLEYGQVDSSIILRRLAKTNQWSHNQMEDSIINMARDQIIEKLISPGRYFYKKNYWINSDIINFNNNYKPIESDSSKYVWKISYFKLNSIIKLELAVNVAEEFFCDKFKIIIKSCFSKNAGNNLSIAPLDWFSLDSLKDYTEEISCCGFFDELFIIQLVENSCMNQFILKVNKCSYKFKTDNILDNLRKRVIENFINNQFGQKFFRVFKTLSSQKAIDENKVSEECIVDKKFIRKFLYQMYRMSFIFLDERNKYTNLISYKNIASWKLNLNMLLDRCLFDVYKSIYNLLLRIEEFNLLIKKNTKEKNRNYHFKEFKYNQIDQLNILRLSIFRLDEILIILEKEK